MTQMVQNFFNFFNPAMFWLTFLPFFHRLGPIFAANATTPSPETFRSADVPDFNVANIYFDTFSPDGIAVQARLLYVMFGLPGLIKLHEFIQIELHCAVGHFTLFSFRSFIECQTSYLPSYHLFLKLCSYFCAATDGAARISNYLMPQCDLSPW